MPRRVASWLKDIRSRILRVQAKIEGLTLADYEGDLDLREICERNWGGPRVVDSRLCDSPIRDHPGRYL